MAINNSELEAQSSPNENPSWNRLQEVPFAGEPSAYPEETSASEEAPTPEEVHIPETSARPEKAPVPLPDLPTKSPNLECGFYLREIERQGDLPSVKAFLESALNREYRDFPSDEQLDQFCDGYSERLSASISSEDEAVLRDYSGFNYKYINQVARGFWDYDLLGPKTSEKFEQTMRSVDKISSIISEAPQLGENLIAHRGTNLDGFRKYNISSISDLKNLQNQFFLESGFTSTSLSRDRSFADRKDFDDPLRHSCNVEIEYLIPAENKETVGLFSEGTSYSPEQREVLIDKGSLSFVTGVEINPGQTGAKLQMVLIPRQIYDPATR